MNYSIDTLLKMKKLNQKYIFFFKDLIEGSKIIEEYTYKLVDNNWILTEPDSMKDIIFTDRAFGVGCFVMQKD